MVFPYEVAFTDVKRAESGVMIDRPCSGYVLRHLKSAAPGSGWRFLITTIRRQLDPVNRYPLSRHWLMLARLSVWQCEWTAHPCGSTACNLDGNALSSTKAGAWMARKCAKSSSNPLSPRLLSASIPSPFIPSLHALPSLRHPCHARTNSERPIAEALLCGHVRGMYPASARALSHRRAAASNCKYRLPNICRPSFLTITRHWLSGVNEIVPHSPPFGNSTRFRGGFGFLSLLTLGFRMFSDCVTERRLLMRLSAGSWLMWSMTPSGHCP